MHGRAWRRASRFGAVISSSAFVLASSSTALARHRLRPRFEPGDLTLEEPGTLALDEQLGGIRSQGPWRLIPTDFELGLGLTRNLELSVDGAYAVEGPPAGPYSFDHSAPDLLWLSAKVGLLDAADDEAKSAWAMGLRLGPKLPSVPGSRGLGFEGLAVLQGKVAQTGVVLNFGGLVDPAADSASPRPVGGEGSLGVDQDLDAQGRYSLGIEISGAHFTSSDPDQLLISGSMTYVTTSGLELSVTDLFGLVSGSDRYGLLLGFCSRWSAWRAR
jgi:hypothetical protein